jgi:dihydroorotate dehydrogenase electron transfer subunit
MSNPLHAAYYADRAVQARVTILENVRLAKDTFRVRFECPEIARQIVPGQFLMVRLAGGTDPLLGRPLALYDIHSDALGQPQALDVVYLVKGRLTSRLCQFLPGQKLDVWGPLGNGFTFPDTEHVILVAGGIGQTPFVALGAELLGRKTYGTDDRVASRARRVTLCYGARSADYLAGVDDFSAQGIDVRLATDDGSRGRRGFVTDLLAELFAESTSSCRVICCGPEIMMHKVAQLCQTAGVPCQVSLETPMACGIGICYTCVAKVRDESGGWDYKRTCVEGPVFDAECLEW